MRPGVKPEDDGRQREDEREQGERAGGLELALDAGRRGIDVADGLLQLGRQHLQRLGVVGDGVLEFREEHFGLEELFMSITEGIVQ